MWLLRLCTSRLLCGQIWLGHYDTRHGLLIIQGSGNAGTGVRALLPSCLACSLNFCALALVSSHHVWLVPAPVSLFHLLALCSALCSRLLALSWRLEALFYSALIFSHLFALAPPLAVYSPLSSIALAPARSLVTILPGRTYRLGFRSHKALFCYTVKSMQNNKPWYCRRSMIIVFTMIYGVVLWCVELRLPWLLLFRIKLIIDPSETPVVTMRYHHKVIWSQEGSHTFEIAVHFSLQKDRFCTSSYL